MTPCGALRASSPSSATSFFLRFGCGDAFCTDTFLQVDDVTHRNLYTEELLRRYLCTKKRLYTDAFTHRGFYAKKEVSTHSCFDAFARINVTQAFLHTEPFPQRNLCTEQFLHMFFLHKKHLTQKNLYTQTAHNFFTDPLYCTGNFIQNKIYTAEPFSHRSLYTQKQIRSTFFTDRQF